MLLRRALAVAAIAAVTVLGSGQARADAPPDPPEKGLREIPYSFTVKGLAAAPDQVLFAYWCESDQAVTKVLTKLAEGAEVRVRYRGGDCALYAIEKAQYEAWVKSYPPNLEHRLEHPKLKKLVDSARKCQGGPTPTYTTGKNDKRASFEETITVTTLNATSCVVTTSGAPVPTPPAKGCGSCASTEAASGSTSLLTAAVVASILALRRRRASGER